MIVCKREHARTGRELRVEMKVGENHRGCHVPPTAPCAKVPRGETVLGFKFCGGQVRM